MFGPGGEIVETRAIRDAFGRVVYVPLSTDSSPSSGPSSAQQAYLAGWQDALQLAAWGALFFVFISAQSQKEE